MGFVVSFSDNGSTNAGRDASEVYSRKLVQEAVDHVWVQEIYQRKLRQSVLYILVLTIFTLVLAFRMSFLDVNALAAMRDNVKDLHDKGVTNHNDMHSKASIMERLKQLARLVTCDARNR